MLIEQALGNGMKVLVGRPSGSGPHPSVVLIHERYGIVQHQLDLAERLASEGFVACLPDLFHRFEGDRDALAKGDARCEMKDNDSLADLDATLAFLRDQNYVIDDQIGIVGVCQSGREPLLYAGHRDDVAAVAVLYGAGSSDWQSVPDRPEPLGSFIPNIRCPVLGLFGEADHVVSVEDVTRLRGALENARKSYRIRVYLGAPHGWLNDTMPGRFRARATEEAWAELTGFLRSVFNGQWHHGNVSWDYRCETSPGYDFSKNVRLA